MLIQQSYASLTKPNVNRQSKHSSLEALECLVARRSIETLSASCHVVRVPLRPSRLILDARMKLRISKTDSETQKVTLKATAANSPDDTAKTMGRHFWP